MWWFITYLSSIMCGRMWPKRRYNFIISAFAHTGQFSGDLRLVDNSGRTGGSSGRLEFYYIGLWGTVCENGFSSNDARVACRQLGYSTSTPRYGRVGTLG